MSRAERELSGRSCTGPQDGVFLTTSVSVQGDDEKSWSAYARLVSFVPEADAYQRLELLAASIGCGQSIVTSISSSKFDDLNWFERQGTALVLAIPSARKDVIESIGSWKGLTNYSPVLVITDNYGEFAHHSGASVDAVVQAPSEDLIGAAAVVFRMMVSLIAPAAFTCTDHVDVMQVLRSGNCSRLSLPLWSAQTGLIFRSAEERRTLESASGVLMHLDFENIGSLQAFNCVRREVRAIAPSTSTVIVIGPAYFFVRGDLRSFQPVPLLCVGP